MSSWVETQAGLRYDFSILRRLGWAIDRCFLIFGKMDSLRANGLWEFQWHEGT